MEVKSSIIYQKAYNLSLDIVRVYKKFVTNEMRDLFRQLLRSGTSVGANLAEAVAGISEADFSAKVSIAYKEANETRYWLSVLKDTGHIDNESYILIDAKTEEICRIAFSILKSTGRIKKKY